MQTSRQIAKRDENQTREIFPSFRSPFSRFFDEAFWDPFRLFDTSLLPSVTGTMQAFTPFVDVSETDKEVVIEADIPNFDPKNVKVDIANNMLTINGTQEEKMKGDGRKWHRRERSYSYNEFTRQILLPDYVDGSKAECKMRHGTLEIRIPKKPEAEPKHLQVKIES